MSIALRPIGADDEAFLFSLYTSTRQAEMAAWGWDAPQREAFLHLQFRAQRQHYQTLTPPAEQRIICYDDRPIGWIAIVRGEQIIQLADIALLPEYRNKGIGTTLIQSVLTSASRVGCVVQLHVLHGNQAIRLYQRLGFTTIGDNGVHAQMQWRASLHELSA